ncbi:CinA family protein [Gordonia jinhuaensis]|uniref:Competence protein n=1 Tax=Gordonia jinhuaensis TaxID=1517702 RepID=A0A916T0G8_9ACTN|nr:nicotinamide-nucleotide amidohydrolase family protein [Gordonia jinhuaensis]GGB26189.1 competence protein [Gordonia jinhuaensis]
MVGQIRARELVAALTGRGETVATAESLTAGLLAASIAGVPGSSAVLRGGLIVYATDLKHSLADVDERTLAEHGPVSVATARALARGAMRRCGADWGVSLTGVAGPDAQDGHLPGEVYCGLAYRHAGVDDTRVSRLAIEGDRWDVRSQSAAHATDLLLSWIADAPVPPQAR